MSTRREKMGRALAVLALASMTVGFTAATAHADWRYDHRDDWRRHHRVYYGPQTYVTPPPPVYYAPPPPPSGLNLFFHIR